MTGDGETVTPLLPEPGVWTGMAIGQCLGAVEVEARENPSGLGGDEFSGRIKKPDIRQQL